MLFKKIGQYTREINEFKMKNQRLDHENIVIKQDVRICLFVCLINTSFFKNCHHKYNKASTPADPTKVYANQFRRIRAVRTASKQGEARGSARGNSSKAYYFLFVVVIDLIWLF